MGMTPFNSVAGFSVGKGTANVILANGDVVTNNITVSNKANLSAISNVIITGGTAGQFIQTDGSGNLTFATVTSVGLANGNSNIQVYSNGNVTVSVAGVSNVLVVSNTGANVTGYITATGNITGANANLGNAATANYFTGTLTTNAQPNITSVGTLTALDVTGNATAGNVTGANLVSANYFTGTLTTNAQPNITSVGSLSSLTVTGNANVGNLGTAQVLATTNVTAPQLISNIATGTAPFVVTSTTQVANLNAATAGTAGSATTAGTVTTNAQPNITSVGTLTALSVSGNANIGNVGTVQVLATANVTAPQLISNVATGTAPLVVTSTTQVANLNAAKSGTVTTNAQPNITSVGTLTALSVSGNANVGNLGTNGLIIATGNVSGGNLTTTGSLSVTGNANIGNIGTAQVLATANITTPQVIANIASGTAPFVINSMTKVANLNAAFLDGYDTATANTINTVAVRDGYGNLSANFFIGNGSQLSGIITSVSNISNGTSNLNIASSDGNVTVSVGGVANVLTVTTNSANITGNANVSGNVSANYFSGNGSSLTGLTFNALTDAVTANVTIDEVVYQGTTRLIVGHTGTSGYTFTQYTGLNPTLYAVSGTTLALDLTSVGHPFLVQYSNGANCDLGLTHVDTTGVLSAGALAQAKTSGTLYWQIPINLVGNFKYQCFNHVAMNGVFVLNDGNFSNGIASYTGNIGAGNVNVTGKVTAANIISNTIVTANVLNLNNSGPQFGTNPGDMVWNNTSKTYELLMAAGVQQSIGQEQFILVKANTTITTGQVVAFAGVSAGIPIGDPANAQAYGFVSGAVLGVAAQNIGIGNTGYVTAYGRLDNVNTNSFNIGDTLYLDPAVPGGLTNVLPNAPNAKILVGTPLVKALTTGSLQIRVTNFPQLNQLSDVSTTTPTNNQYLKYTTSGNYWTTSNLAISNDPSPNLGANLNAANFSFANVNDISANTANFNGAVYSNAIISNASQLATKAYVDNASSAGISVHPPVLVGTPTALTTTYAQGGTTPTITTIATGNVLTTSTTHSLSVNDVIVFGTTTNGLTAGTPYFVYSIPAINQITLSTAYNGIQITTLTNGTGLSITSRANSGVGATLTNAGAQAALVIGGVTMATTNRVLVFGQTNAFENGVYTVTNIGSPSTNWVLTRATEQNKYIPASTSGMSAGSYFYIESGTRAGESDVLSTTGVIIIGTTNLTYTLFSASLQYTGTSPVTIVGQQISLANLTGTGDFVVLANSPTLNTPNIGAATGTSLNVSTGNINAGNLILTGLTSVTGNVSAGNLNAQSGNVNANVYLGNRVSVGGNIDGGNFNPSGNLVVSGNASAANISTAGTLSVTGNANVGNIGAARGVFTSNVTAGNANVTGQLISTVATGTAPFVVTSTTKVANLVVEVANTSSYVNVATVTSNVSYPTFVYANITGDYPLQSNTAFSANLANGAFISTTHVGNLVGTTANVTGQLISTVATGTAPLVVSSTTLVANLNANVLQGSAPAVANTASTIALRDANGNVSANFFIGNGSQLTGIVVAAGASIVNGSSNVVVDASANVRTSVGGVANVLVVTTTGADIAGTLNTGASNANVGNLGAAQVLATANVTTPQVIANIAQGTAPFLVNSNTVVANLNASLLLGATSAVANTASTIALRDAKGNVSANFFVGNGSQLTGIITSVANLSNGTSNVNAGTLNGNITVSIGGTANTVVFTGTGVNIAGYANLGTGDLTTTGNANVGNLGTAQVLATANVTAPQLISNIAIGTAPFVVTSTTQVANLSVATAGTATVAGSVTTNAQANITSVGTLTGLGVNGTVTAVNITANTGVFTGNGNGLSSLVGANVTGQVGNAAIAGSVFTNAQPNITSVGTLTSLTVTGNASAGNVTAVGGMFSGNGNGLSSLTGANVTGTVANATFATTAGSATTAGTVTTNAQPNITSVGTLNNLVVTVNANVGNLLTDNLKYANGSPYIFSTNPGGANTQIQFNDASTFAGSANLTFDKTTNTFTTFRVLAANIGNATSILAGDGGLISNISVAGGTSIVNGTSNVIVGFNGNITMSSAGNANVQVVTGTGVNVNGTLNVTGVSTLGAIGNVKITGGTANYVLTTDGSGNLSFTAPSVKQAVQIVSANTTLSPTVSAYFAAGPITLTLPDATTNVGETFYIKNTNNQFVTIQGINTINGYTNMVLRYLNSAITLISNGVNWNIF